MFMSLAANDFIIVQRNWECPYACSRSWFFIVNFSEAILWRAQSVLSKIVRQWNSDNKPFAGGMCFLFSFLAYGTFILRLGVNLFHFVCRAVLCHLPLVEMIYKIFYWKYCGWDTLCIFFWYCVLLFWICWLRSLDISVRGLEYGWPCQCKALYHCFEQTQQ